MACIGLAVSPLVISACPGDNNGSGASGCSLDIDCADDAYCSVDGVCAQDCDPTATQGLCAQGETCTARSECVDVTIACSVPTDCGDAPGGDPFCDGDTSVQPDIIGRCIEETPGAGKQCVYDDERIPCTEGCNEDSGLCNGGATDPCDGVTCNMPPADTCSDGQTLVTYMDSGMCNEGECSYQSMESTCPNGCMDDACIGGADMCTDTTCDDISPPAPTCSDTNPDVVVEATGGPNCVDDDGAPECVFDFETTNCAYTGGTCNGGACEGAIAQSSEVIVTEYMVNPEGSGQTKFRAQWIEVTNTTGSDIDLNGWTIGFEDANGLTEHTIANQDANGMMAPLNVPAGGYLLLANGADPLFDGATTPDYQYADVVMEFEGALTLKDGAGDVSDFVYWEEGAVTRASARQLSPDAMRTADANDDVESWCPNLTDGFGGESNFGTPVGANTACADDPCSVFSCGQQPGAYCNAQGNAVTFTEANPTCEVSRFNNPFCDFGPMERVCDPAATLCVGGTCEMIPSNLPNATEVIFTEFMGNPSATDSAGEWLELHNTTDQPVSLFTLTIEDNEMGSRASSWQILDPDAVIPANSYAVFITNTDAASNGGIKGGYALGSGLLKNNPDLDPNTGESLMTLRLVDLDGVVIDTAYYGEPTDGAAQQLDAALYLNTTMADEVNDAAASYCPATVEYNPFFGTGSPGSDNEMCP